MIFKLIKIGSRPLTLVYPIPAFSFLGFCFSEKDYISFLISYVFGFFFFTAINLWNHINDAEDDIKAGKKEATMLIDKKFEATLFVIVLYFTSLIIVILFSKEKVESLIAYAVCVAFTWLYSDKIWVGRILKRLKEDYRTELLTYFTTTPSFFLLFWTFFSKINLVGILFVVITSSIYISGFFLKDLKDISADMSVGYKTLGVVFPPQFLIKMSLLWYILTFFLVFYASITGIISFKAILSLIIFVIILYTTYKFKSNNWIPTQKIEFWIKLYVNSYLVLTIFLGILVII